MPCILLCVMMAEFMCICVHLCIYICPLEYTVTLPYYLGFTGQPASNLNTPVLVRKIFNVRRDTWPERTDNNIALLVKIRHLVKP